MTNNTRLHLQTQENKEIVRHPNACLVNKSLAWRLIENAVILCFKL